MPVSVSPVLQKNDTRWSCPTIGNVEAFSNVAIKSRIGGELKKVHFQEGQEVRQGDLLFYHRLPCPMRRPLKQAQANLARTVALAKKAEEDLRRYQDLVQKECISQEQYDQSRANAEALQASLEGRPGFRRDRPVKS